MTKADAVQHIEMLYPPDSEYDDTRAIGRELMDNTIVNSMGYRNWRELPESDLVKLAIANLTEGGEDVSRFV